MPVSWRWFCFLTQKQKRALNVELTAELKLKQENAEKLKSLEALLTRKEKDLSGLLNKLSETIGEYELKLERKDEQIWTLTYKMNEGENI